MIILDKKSYALLSYLIKLDEPETVMTISKKLKQSRRKIYYHLEKINDALPTDVEQIISYSRVGIVLNVKQKAACRLLLKELDAYSYVMSINERMQLILLYIGVSDQRVTIEKLMQLTDVSRNTVLNDLNEVRQELSLEQYQIQLHVTKAQGYYLDCHPLSKIQFIYKLLYTLYTQGSEDFITMVQDKIEQFTSFNRYFSKQKLDYLRQLLVKAKKDLGKQLNSQDSDFMFKILPYLLMSYRNMDITDEDREVFKQDFLLAQERIEYYIAEKLARDYQKKFQVTFDDVENCIIAMLLLSFRKDSDIHNDSHDYDEMRLTLGVFLDRFEKLYQVNFEHRDELLNQLLTHCKALLYRKTYGVLSVNLLTEQIMNKYEELFYMTKSCVSVLEEAWFIKMNDDDIAYLTIHLGGALRNSSAQTFKPTKVIIVCDEGIGVRKFLFKQCQAYVVRVQIDAVFTSEQFHSVKDILNSDVVISTSDGIDSPLPMMVIHPVLTDDDIVKLIAFVRTHGQESQHDFSDELDHLIKNYIKEDSERYTLRSQIEKIFRQELLLDLRN